MDKTHKEKPAVMIVFGASGNLMSKKIIPALYSLFNSNKLPQKFKIIGIGRSDYTGDKFCKEIVVKSIKKYLDEDFPDDHCFTFFEYLRGDINNVETFVNIQKRLDEIDEIWGEESNKIFYYSVYADLYETLSEQISKICQNKDNVRLMIEKPFGKSEKDAKDLDKGIKQYFEEKNIYRVDHYLDKEIMLRANEVKSLEKYKDRWNKDHIESIENVALEDFGVEGRGAFYEGVGALLDVGQNHMLSVLSIILSEVGEDSSESRAKVLENLPILSSNQIESQTIRAQYEEYLDIPDVPIDSKIETYFKLNFEMQGDWEGVDVLIEAGKAMPAQSKYITVKFKEGDELRFEYYPNACASSKSKDEERKELECAEVEHQYVAEYTKIIMDAIAMDSTNFLSIEEVISQWKFIDPIRQEWDRDGFPLKGYKKGTRPN